MWVYAYACRCVMSYTLPVVACVWQLLLSAHLRVSLPTLRRVCACACASLISALRISSLLLCVQLSAALAFRMCLCRRVHLVSARVPRYLHVCVYI